jgi:hypothetical protein
MDRMREMLEKYMERGALPGLVAGVEVVTGADEHFLRPIWTPPRPRGTRRGPLAGLSFDKKPRNPLLDQLERLLPRTGGVICPGGGGPLPGPASGSDAGHQELILRVTVPAAA